MMSFSDGAASDNALLRFIRLTVPSESPIAARCACILIEVRTASLTFCE
jgi:hypothetical protein